MKDFYNFNVSSTDAWYFLLAKSLEEDSVVVLFFYKSCLKPQLHI